MTRFERGGSSDELPIRREKIPTDLTLKDFDYDLPPECIAQSPAQRRDESRLLKIDRQSGALSHHIFRDVVDFLQPGDVLVVNESKVIPARLYGRREETGAQMELLLLRSCEKDVWEVLVKPGRRAKPGTVMVFGEGLLRAEVLEVAEDGNRFVRFHYDAKENFYAILDRIGQMPLPPYITKRDNDPSRYQTVYAKQEGSAAAPTAGLHFTPELLEAIRAKGVRVVPVLLHVGLGTFRPVKEEHIADHVMHTEHCEVTQEAADAINQRSGRVIAVGTTSCRVLESVADEEGKIHPFCGETGIFLYPGCRFRIVDGLITNFHLPQSTLLMLVSAFSSRKIMLHAYQTAIAEGYRFFSYGDACLIV